MSTVKAANLQNTGSGAPTFKNSSGTEIGTLCRAWVSFDGTGTVAIRDDFNVSSITDNGTGDYTVTFSNAMPDRNYCICASRGQNGNTNPSYVMTVRETFSPPSTSSFTFTTNGATGGSADSTGVYTAVFR